MPFFLEALPAGSKSYEVHPSRTIEFEDGAQRFDGRFTKDAFTYYLGGNKVNPTSSTSARECKNSGAPGWHLGKSIAARLRGLVTAKMQQSVELFDNVELVPFVEPGACHPLHWVSSFKQTKNMDKTPFVETWSRHLLRPGGPLFSGKPARPRLHCFGARIRLNSRTLAGTGSAPNKDAAAALEKALKGMHLWMQCFLPVPPELGAKCGAIYSDAHSHGK